MNVSESNTFTYFLKSGYPLTKINKICVKTPDFEGTELLVEVKKVSPERIEGLSNDSTYNAIKNSLKRSSNQFESYDPGLKKWHIVVIYSRDIISDDIYSVWTGEWSQEYRIKCFKSGMVLSNSRKQYIDAIAWFKKESDPSPKFVWAVNEHLRRYFPEISQKN